MQYQPQIDGLRAISVASVIIYHAKENWLPGGFLGVDVFFVISGYLITSILLRDIDAGRFSISDFYERRVRRIGPALVATMLLTVALAPLLLPHQIMDVGQSLAAAMTFSSNYFFYFETDYFNAFTNINPLLHTWSLAVEEQYYLLYPLILLVLSRIGRKAVLLGLIAILVTSFFMAVTTTNANPQLSFYATQTRAWELMAGSILAFGSIGGTGIANSIQISQRSLEWISAAALLMLGASIILISPSMAHPGWPTLIPVGATLTLLACSGRSNLLRVVLGNQSMVYVGLLSYSLYMYHQPLLTFAHLTLPGAQSGDALPIPAVIGIVSMTFCLSALSYHYFEKPLRHATGISRRAAFIGFGFTAMFIIGLGLSAHFSKGYLAHFVEHYADTGGVRLVNVDREKKALAATRKQARSEQHALFDPHARNKVLVLGDSFALDAYLALRTGPRDTVSARLLDADDECMDTLAEDLDRTGRTVACVLHASRAQIVPLLEAATHVLVSAQWLDSTIDHLPLLTNELRKRTNASIVVVSSIQFNDISSVSLLLARNGISASASGPAMYQNIRQDRLRSSDRLRELVRQENGISWVDKKDFFCEDFRASCRLFDTQGQPLIWDHGHLTVRALESYGRFILNELEKLSVDQSEAGTGVATATRTQALSQGETN